jgi:uncharacterized membrane protein
VSGGSLFVAVFLACLVEAVEALTIVLAAATRHWRSSLTGLLVALATLAVLIAALGPALTAVPLHALRLVVGGLLLVFGLQWLRKAILRASGYKDLHNEEESYAAEVAAARTAPHEHRRGVDDWYAFTLAFKGVLLEGLEVVFIALTFGSNAHNLPLASIAAGAAVLVIGAVGVAVRAPLAKVPENAMKFVVGIMLTAFGTFWGAEGAGARWPGSDAALPIVVVSVAGLAFALVLVLRRTAPTNTSSHSKVLPAEVAG